MKWTLALVISLVSFLSACTPQGSRIDDGFLGGVKFSEANSSVILSSSTVLTGDSVSITVTTRDSSGNLYYIPNSNPIITFSTRGGTSEGTFSSVTNNHDGTYTATFTGVSAGTAITVVAAIDGQAVATSASLQVISGNYQSFTMNLPFMAGSDSSYILSDSTKIDLTGGVVRLTPANQTDDNGSVSKFGGATMSGVQWDSNLLRLNATTNTAELDASWTPQFNSLVGYWKLNGNFNASIGSNMSAAAAGASISNSIYKLGSGSVYLDGTTYASTTASSTYAFANTTFTVALWVKAAQVGGNGWLITNGGTNYGWGIFSAGGGYLNVFLKDCANNQFALNSAPYIADGSWHFVTVVITTDTTTTGNNNIQAYIDGNLNVSTVALPSDNGPYCNPGSSMALALGGRYVPTSPNGFFNGNIDDVAIWSTGLTAAQIQTIYQRQSAKYSGLLTSRVMDAYSSYSWTTLAATTTLPFYKELPGSAGSETSVGGYSAQTASLMNNLIAYWSLNGTTGSISNGATVPSGVGSTGTMVGGTARYLTGELNQGIAFSGAGNYVNFGGSSGTLGSTDITLGMWVKTTSSTSNGYLFGGWGAGGVGAQFAYGMGTTGKISFYSLAGSTRTTATVAINDGTWHHVAWVYSESGQTISIYIDGKFNSTGAAGAINWNGWQMNLNGDSTGSNGIAGSYDDVAIWSRALTQAEVLELYRRGANRIKYQVRSCSASDCSDQEALTTTGKGWKGPDNTQLSYFSELYNTTGNVLGGTVSTGTPVMTFSNFSGTGLSVSNNRYFQYRAVLESDDQNLLCTYNSTASSCSPELQAVTIGPNHYDTTIQSVISKASLGSTYRTIDTNGFTETLGSNSCSAGSKYAISSDGTNFYYYNGTTWTTSNDYNTANDAATMRSNISSYPGFIASGTLQIKAFLKSNGTSACEIDNLAVVGKRY